MTGFIKWFSSKEGKAEKYARKWAKQNGYTIIGD